MPVPSLRREARASVRPPLALLGLFFLNCAFSLLLFAQAPPERQKQVELERLKGQAALNPDDAQAWFQLGIHYYAEMDDAAEATRALQEAVRLRPDVAAFQLALAHALSDNGKLEQARLHYLAAIRLEPDNPFGHSGIGSSFLRQGNWEGAETALQEAVRLKPDFFDAYAGLAFALARQGKEDKALAAYQELVRLDRGKLANILRIGPGPDDTPAGHQALQVEWEEFEQAEEHAASRLAFALGFGLAVDNPEITIRHLRETARRAPQLALAQQFLAWSYFERNNFKDAIRAAQAAIRANPRLPRAHLVLARAYRGVGRTEDTIAAYEAAIRAAPGLDSSYASLGMYLMNLEREREALQVTETGLQADPDSTMLWNNAAWLFATATDPKVRNPEKALEYAHIAVHSAKQPVPAYLDTLAEAYYVNGLHERAIETIKKAIEIWPENQYYRDQLAKFEEARARTPQP